MKETGMVQMYKNNKCDVWYIKLIHFIINLLLLLFPKCFRQRKKKQCKNYTKFNATLNSIVKQMAEVESLNEEMHWKWICFINKNLCAKTISLSIIFFK